MSPLEKYPLSERLLSLWLEETIIHGIGYIKVTNYGGSYAWVDNGIYSVKKNGFTHQGRKTPQEQLRVIRGLITKYHNFERNGYKYLLRKGSWQRMKLNADESI